MGGKLGKELLTNKPGTILRVKPSTNKNNYENEIIDPGIIFYDDHRVSSESAAC
jgi:hypothetical protein